MSSKTRSMATYTLLSYVADECGFETVEEMLASAVCDGTCPGVCLHCHTVVECLEPDGSCECEECGSTVKSVLLIGGMI